MIRSAWDLLTHVVSTAPIWFWPMFAAVVLTVLATQEAKHWLPAKMGARQRHHATRLVAVIIGMGISFALWPAELHWKHGAVIGAIVSMGVPACYPLVMKIIEHRWPWLRKRLSGDKPNREN